MAKPWLLGIYMLIDGAARVDDMHCRHPAPATIEVALLVRNVFF